LKAQEKTMVAGRVLAAEKPLPGATVSITRLQDSTQLTSVITGNDGRFIIQSLPQKDSLKIEISYVGYAPFKGLLLLKDKRFSMAPITLQPQLDEMDAVIIKVEKLATVKGDTVEFRASAIKTPPNSVASDMVKRIPGLELSRDGKLTYNGRPVTKILVDGKPFFGDDGAVALSNIPAEMIEKIQLANDSLQAGTGRVDTDPNQILNFKLKPGKKYFARGYAAAGTDKRYDGSLFGSRVVDKERLSLTLGRNNINKAGINSDNSVQLLTNGSGITKTTFGGLDYGTKWKEDQSMNASYGFNLPTTVKESVRERREDILNAASLITNTKQTAVNTSSNHRGDLRYQAKGEKQELMLTAGANYTTIDNLVNNGATTMDGQGNLLNALSSEYRSKGNSFRANMGVDGERRFSKRGRSLEWDLGLTFNSGNTTDHNDALTLFYENNAVDSQYHFLQEIENRNHTTNANLNLRYREPLGAHTWLNLRNNLSERWGKSDRTTWIMDSLGKRIEVDSLYSNAFTNNAISNATEASFSYRDKNWNLLAGASVLQNFTLQKDAVKKIEFRQSTTSPALRTNINYSTKKESWSLNTAASYVLPTLQQLQPVADVTNPLYIVEGNPELSPQINYTNNFNWRNKKLQVNGRPAAILNSIDLNWNVAHDKIINAVSYDSLGRQTTTYKNVNGVYEVGARVQFSFQRKWGAHYFNAGIRPGISYQKDKTFINGALCDNERTSVQSSLSLSYRKGDAISVVMNYAPSINRMHYEQNTSLNQSYTLHAVNLDVDLYLLKRIKMSQSFDYTYNNSLPAAYDRSSFLWNASASYVCLKNKKGEISVSAFDILQQFNNLVRNVGSNYIEDTQSNNLQRYVMVGFKYFFGKIKEDN
jgi:hypothetical protein